MMMCKLKINKTKKKLTKSKKNRNFNSHFMIVYLIYVLYTSTIHIICSSIISCEPVLSFNFFEKFTDPCRLYFALEPELTPIDSAFRY